MESASESLTAIVNVYVCVCARSWLCGCVGAWVANTESQWIRLANWKINSVAVAGIDKEKYRELEKLLHAAFLLCVSLSSLRLCVCVLTHTLTSFLLTNDFSFRLRYFSLTRAFCLILRFTAHPSTHSPIHIRTELLTDIVVDFHSQFSHLEKRRKLSKKRKDLFRFDQN